MRLYDNSWEQDNRLAIEMQATNQPVDFLDTEKEITEQLLQQLSVSCLVEETYDIQQCQSIYRLHQVIADFLRNGYLNELPKLFQRVYQFHRSNRSAYQMAKLFGVQILQEPLIFALNVGDQQDASYLGILLMQRMLQSEHSEAVEQLVRQQTQRTQQNEAEALLGLAQMHYQLGNWAKAEQLAQQALEVARAEQNSSNIAQALGQLGSIERNRGNWDAAEQLYRQCLEIETELGDRSGMASSWGALGDIERKRGNWDAAEQLYRQSLELRTELGDRSGIATSIGCLGETELGRKNFAAAEKLLLDALSQMETLGMTWHIAETNYDFALLERQRGNTDRAKQYYATAHQLFTQLGAAKDLEKIEQEWNDFQSG